MQIVGAAALLGNAFLVHQLREPSQRRPDAVGSGPSGAQPRFEGLQMDRADGVDHARSHIGDDPARRGHQWVLLQQLLYGSQAASGREDERDVRVLLELVAQAPAIACVAFQQCAVQVGHEDPGQA